MRRRQTRPPRPPRQHPRLRTGVVLGGVAVLAALLPAGATQAAPPTEEQRSYTSLEPTAIGYATVRDAAVARNGSRLLVLTDDNLRTLDITRSPATTAAVSNTVFGEDLVVRGETAYVLRDDALVVVDVSRDRARQVRTLRGVAPDSLLGAAVSGGGRWLYVSYGSGFPSSAGYGVKVLSLANPRKPVKVATATTEPFPVAVAVNPQNTRMIATNALGGSVTVTDVSTPRKPRTVVRQLDLPFQGDAVVTSKDGSRAYVWSSEDGEIAVVGLKRGTLLRVKTVARQGITSAGISRSPDGSTLVLNRSVNDDEVGVIVLRRKTLTKVQGFTGVLYPPATPFSSGGPTKGHAYIVGDSTAVGPVPAIVYPLRPDAG